MSFTRSSIFTFIAGVVLMALSSCKRDSHAAAASSETESSGQVTAADASLSSGKVSDRTPSRKNRWMERVRTAKTNEQKWEVLRSLRALKTVSYEEMRIKSSSKEGIDEDENPLTVSFNLPLLFQDWFITDSDEARKAALTQGEDASDLLACGVEAHAMDREWLVSFLKKLQGEKSHDYIARCICSSVSTRDPGMAMSLLNDPVLDGCRRSCIEEAVGAFHQSTARSFKDTLEWIRLLKDPEDQQYAIAVAVNQSQNIFPPMFSDDSGSVKNPITQEDYLQISKLMKDPALLASAYHQYLDDEVRSHGILSFVERADLSMIPEKSKQELLQRTMAQAEEGGASLEEAIQQVSAGRLSKMAGCESALALALAENWNYRDAQSYVLSLSDSNPAKKDAVCALAKALAAMDTNRAARWIESLPAGELRESARAVVTVAREETKQMPTD